jgi:hypothetical protein
MRFSSPTHIAPDLAQQLMDAFDAGMRHPTSDSSLVSHRVPSLTWVSPHLSGKQALEVITSSVRVERHYHAAHAVSLYKHIEKGLDTVLGEVFQLALAKILCRDGLIGGEAQLTCDSLYEGRLLKHRRQIDFWHHESSPPFAIEIKTLFSGAHTLSTRARQDIPSKFIPITTVLRKKWPDVVTTVILIHARHLVHDEPRDNNSQFRFCPLNELVAQLRTRGDYAEKRDLPSAKALGAPQPLFIRVDGSELLDSCREVFPDFDRVLGVFARSNGKALAS